MDAIKKYNTKSARLNNTYLLLFEVVRLIYIMVYF